MGEGRKEKIGLVGNFSITMCREMPIKSGNIFKLLPIQYEAFNYSVVFYYHHSPQPNR